MTTKPRVSQEQILAVYLGKTEKSAVSECITNQFSDGSYRFRNASHALNATIEADGTHNCPEGELFVYRECGKTACRRQVGMVIDYDNRIIDAQPFVAPCTGKLWPTV